MDAGLLIVRIVIGLLLAGHGAQKLFGWFGGYGLAGTGGWMESIGYRPGRRSAFLAGAAELGAGLLLMLGFLTPLGSAICIGVMVNAIGSVHRGKGVWATNGGFELPLLFATIATAVAFIGPGEASIDDGLGWNLAGNGWGVAFFALGFVAGFAMLASRKVEPVVDVRGDATTTISSSADVESNVNS
jgi:putative oxidoreductase